MRGHVARHSQKVFGLPCASWSLALMLLAAATTSPETARSETRLIAERITAENFETHHVGGPDADAGIDDWFLSNGTLCAAVSDAAHESPLVPTGGVLIDVGHCGREDDQWSVLQPMLNLAQSTVVPIRAVDSGAEGHEAWIETRGVFSGVEITTRFSVSDRVPNVLDVETRATRKTEGGALFALGQIVLHAGAQTRPYSMLLGRDEASYGFHYPPADRHSLLSLLGALHRADLTVLVGQEALEPISYGIETREAWLEQPVRTDSPRSAPERAALRSFNVVGEHFTSTNVLSAPLWLGEEASPPSFVDLGRIPWMDLEAGATIVSRSRIWIADRADVASLADPLLEGRPFVEGRIDDPAARLEVSRPDGSAVTFVRPGKDGRFRFRVPPGRYEMVASSGGDRRAELTFEVRGARDGSVDTAEPQRLPPVTLGAPARIQPPAGWTGRLVLIDLESGQPVLFRSSQVEFRVGDKTFPTGLEAPFLNLAPAASPSPRSPLPARPDDPGPSRSPERWAEAREVPPGAYRVLATRGPEYALAETELQVAAGEVVRLDLPPLERLAPNEDWIAADLHVHTAASFDSDLPAEIQMQAFAASGAEVLVATEHDRIVDPRPILERAGLGDAFATVTGVEITSSFQGGDSPHATGHWNAFPVRPEPTAYRRGAPTLEGRRARDAIADFRSAEPGAFLQLNHPRPGVEGGDGDTYFSHLGVAGAAFEPTLSLRDLPNRALTETGPNHPGRDLDYDGVELLNGPDLVRYRRTRADWFSLLLQGERQVGVASSDSHRLGRIVGLPRTYVSLVPDSVASFSQTAFMESLHQGRAYGSTGPQIEVTLGPVGLGEIHTEETGVLRVRLGGVPWLASAYEWRAFVNGELVHRSAIGIGELAELPLVFRVDSFVTVEVEGVATPEYALVHPGFKPFAFSNPIFVDADRDGEYRPPGLPDRLPPTLTTPDALD